MSGGRITYEDAIQNLQSMFSSVDRAVLEMILEQNGGAMEPTIEQILVMEGDSQ
jgi:CUE domain